MSKEFLSVFLPAFEVSPSPSEPDNDLVHELVTQLDKKDCTDVTLATRCLLAWQTKQLPRYFQTRDGELHRDHLSGPKWSPAFYRVDDCLKQVRDMLQGTDVIDPFAGSGSIMYALLALNIANTVTLNDICYPGGRSIWTNEEHQDHFYAPQRNLNEYQNLFESYSAHIPMPPLHSVVDFTAYSVCERLDFSTNEFDWIFTDPPYGRSLKSDGFNGLVSYLPELMRVSRNGALLMIPEEWLPHLIELDGYGARDLTGTLAHKKTKFKTVLAHVYKI